MSLFIAEAHANAAPAAGPDAGMANLVMLILFLWCSISCCGVRRPSAPRNTRP